MSSLGLSVRVTRSGDTRALAQLQATLEPAQRNRLAGAAAEVEFRKNFFGLNGTRANALGGTRTRFYQRAAGATTSAAVAEGAVITVAQQGIRQRYLGGEIKPGPGKQWITLPAIAQAYGQRAGRFNDLRFVLVRKGGNALAMLVRGGGVGPSGPVRPQVVFWLKKSVTQRPDSAVIPRPDVLRSAISTRLIRAATRRTL